MSAHFSDHEAARLDLLRRYHILDTEPEAAFDDLTRLAAYICDAPIALVSLVDEQRQWFKSKVGLEVSETPRDVAFCDYTIRQADVLIVPDTLQDERFVTNPLVTAHPHIRFYAGMPLITPSGYALGTLCVIDRKPRQMTPQQVDALSTLARQVVAQMELRRNVSDLASTVVTSQHAQDALRESEEKFRVMANAAPALIWMSDTNQNFYFFNQRWLDFTGRSLAEEIQAGWLEQVHPDDVQRCETRYVQACEQRQPFTLEYRLKRRDGEYRWVLDTGVPRYDRDGTYEGYIGSCIDITDRRQAEQERDRLFNLSLDLLCVAGLDGYFKRINPSFTRVLGFTLDELRAEPFINFVHPDDRASTLQEVEKLATGIPTQYFENRYRCKDGSYRWLGWTSSPAQDEGLVYAVARDITPLKAAQQERDALLQQEHASRMEAEAAKTRVAKILESITDAFIAMDHEWRFTYINQQAEAILLRSRDDLMGRSIWDEFPDAAATAFYQKYQQAIASQTSVEFEEFYPPLNAWFYVHAYPSEDGLLVYFQNINERKQAEEALRRSEERYRELFESNPHPMWVYDRETLAFLAVNRAAIRHYGYSEEEFLAMTLCDIRPPETIPAFLEQIGQFQDDGEPIGIWQHCKKDGSVIDVEITAHPLDFAGRPATVVLAHDVTERVKAEVALRESEERWQLALRGNNDGIWDWNLKTNDVFFSPRWKEMLGYDDSEIQNHLDEWSARVHPDDRAWVMQAVQDHLDRKVPFYISEHRLQCKDGTYKWILDRGQAFWDEQGHALRMTGSHTDITERKQFEEALQRSNNLLQVMTRIQSQFITDSNPHDLFDRLLGELLELTTSEYGFIGEVVCPQDGEPYMGELYTRRRDRSFLKTHTLSDGSGHEEPRLLDAATAETGLEFPDLQTLLGAVMTTGHLVMSNDPAHDPRRGGTPDGHPTLSSFLGLPFYSDNQLIGMVGIANRPGGYNEPLVAYLQPFLATCGNIIRAYRNDRRKRNAEEELQRQMERSRLLSEISLKIRQSLQLDDILYTSVTEVQKILQSDRVLIFRLISEGKGQIVKEALAPGASSLLNITVTDECFGPDYLRKYRQGRVYMVSDADQADLEPCLIHFMQQVGVKSKLVMPILMKDEFWGLLIAHQCSRPREWFNFEIDLMAQLADQIGIALAQAQMLEQETLQRQELARSNADLQQFAYVASHDLQEPLRMITSYLQLIERRYTDRLDEDANDFINFAVEGATRMQTLINDLLSYSRVDTRGKSFTLIEADVALKRALANLRTAIAESQTTVTHDPLPQVFADETQLTQVFQNLISNAIKFRGTEAPHIHIGVQPHQNEWRFSIRDNGIGIEPQYAEKIFMIFQRLHGRRDYPGTGIGLAICKRIIERHNGCIWVESEPDQGSTFFFTLPAQEENTA